MGSLRAVPDLNAICVDAGMYAGGRAYLEIDPRRHFIGHQQDADGTWHQSDWSEQVCGAHSSQSIEL